jgi:hypothetical protein
MRYGFVNDVRSGRVVTIDGKWKYAREHCAQSEKTDCHLTKTGWKSKLLLFCINL